MNSQRWRRRVAGCVAIAVCALAGVVGAAAPAAAATYTQIAGAGSTWSKPAIDAWTANVRQYGMVVTYAGLGSTTGRALFKQGTVDWAASDIPYGVQDGASSDPPPATRGFAYMPDTAGATTFMYNLKDGASRMTDLRLSGDTIAKIFTGVLTRWNDPAIAADNPGLTLPDIAIVPVVRSDGAGVTYQFTQWMAATEQPYWTAFCAKVGRSPCTPTSAYPLAPGTGIVGQSGDSGVAGYVSQVPALGAIGLVEYSYAIQTGFPVAKVLNAAGYYTQPTPGHVGVSLLAARINSDQTNPATYLTQDLSAVYTNPDARTYELSSYSYMILPTDTAFGFSADRGLTLGDFGKYLLCQGQTQLSALGYSPLPINLVVAGFDQLRRIPGAQVPSTTTDSVRACNNPTFSTDGTNTLAVNDPMPQPCDRQGPTQCMTSSGDGPVAVETINVNVPLSEGVFTMTVSGTPVQLSTPVLVDANSFESTGELSAVTISDNRLQSQPGWSVSCQVGVFSDGGRTFSGSSLGWTPVITTPNGALDVGAGPPVAAGTIPGLSAGSVLASALANHGLGTTVLGAALDLRIASTTAPGSYSATLTVTAVVQG
jgi:phosphate ABC transporter phosphate-binding protein